MIDRKKRKRKKRTKKDGRVTNGGFRPGAGRPFDTNRKEETKLGLRPDVMCALDRQREPKGMTKREFLEELVSEALLGYYGIPEPNIQSIIDTSGLPANEVIKYLLKRSTQ